MCYHIAFFGGIWYNMNMEIQSENLIKNATAILAASGIKVSATAEKDAAAMFAGKKDRSQLCRKGSRGAILFFRTLVSLTRIPEAFDSAALTKLHGFLFEETDFAGKLRTTPAELNGSGFADATLIAGSLKRLVKKLNESSGAPETAKEDFALSLTHYFSEMFLLYPFKTGTLTAMAVFFYHFAVSRGYRLDYFKCGGKRLCEATADAFLTDETSKLFLCLSEALSYLSSESETATVEAVPLGRERKRVAKTKTLVKVAEKKEQPKPKIRQKTAPAEKAAANKRVSTPSPKKASDTLPRPKKTMTSAKQKKASAGELRAMIDDASDEISAVLARNDDDVNTSPLLKLSSATLKTAARLKEKIETLQKRLSDLLSDESMRDDEKKS